MIHHHFFSVSDDDQDPLHSRLTQAFDDVRKDGFAAHFNHRFGHRESQFPHPGPSSCRENYRLGYRTIHGLVCFSSRLAERLTLLPREKACFTYRLTNSSIRSMASFSLSIPVAKQQRTYPSPELPNALPGTTATFFDFNSCRENSLLFRPVGVMFGKA